MEPLCEFCGVVRAVVYCKSDSARLCLHCDGCVHSANYLSRRHHRSLLCDKCNSQPAIVRYIDEKVSVCQNCDWAGNGCSGSANRRQILNGYAGCPSMAEFAKIWSLVLDSPSMEGFDAGLSSGSLLSINEDHMSNCLEPRDNEGSYGLVTSKLNELKPCSKLQPWVGPSVIPPSLNYIPNCRDQPPFFPEESSLSKVISKVFSLSQIGDLIHM